VRLRALAKYVVYNFVPGKKGSLPYFGTPIYFEPGSILARELTLRGFFEPDIVQAIRRFVKPGLMIDVGANVGLMAAPALHQLPGLQCLSFEPNADVVRYLEQSAAGPYRDRWTIRRQAVADKPGHTSFAVTEAADSLFQHIEAQGESGDIEVTTIDREWTALGRPVVSLLKIDVEGAEGKVFAGAAEMLSACRPVVVTEWYQDYLDRFETVGAEILSIAARYRYALYTIPGYVPTRTATDLAVHMKEYSNFLLVPNADLGAGGADGMRQ